MLHVVWFKRDLRVHDHAPLALAAAEGAVLPLYVVEPRLWQQPDAAGRHWAFIHESLMELDAALRQRGQPLCVIVDEMLPALQRLYAQHGAFRLWSHEETGNLWTYARDRAIGKWMRDHGLTWTELPQNGVVRRLRSRDGWAQRWEARMREPRARAPTALSRVADGVPITLDLRPPGLATDLCPRRQAGGRRAGVETLRSFLAERGARYHREMSSPLTAFDSCSRLSAHLAWGTLSLREVVQATRARIAELRKTPADTHTLSIRALQAFVGRLHWHCHFMQKLEDEPELEIRNAHPGYDGLREQVFDEERFAAWCTGHTGLPFVDACMRALIANGWINFRMRAMLMAVASYHLWLHWREPALHLARQFTDYEPGIHYPQAQMQSGTTGINTIRIYNPVKQGLDHDPDGVFIRHWVPELAAIPDGRVHQPWVLPTDVRTALGIVYPEPIVDPVAAAREARDRVWAVRRGTAFHDTADAIQQKHGSRRAGLPATTRKPPRRRHPESPQLTLTWAPDEPPESGDAA